MAPQIRILSPIGSRIAPQVVTASSLRASQPSKKSVTAASRKAISAHR
jgi:hypothetical protein